MNYIVYLTVNKINHKVYVGVHYTNPDIDDGYRGCGVNHKDKKKRNKSGLPAAIRKYGYKNFKRIILKVFPDSKEGYEAAYAMEGKIVNKKFVASKMTYNRTLGGKFTVYENLKKKIAQYTLDGKFIRSWDSISDAERSLNLNAISQNIVGRSKYCGDYQWRYYDPSEADIPPVKKKERPIYQFDLQGNLIKLWPSIAEAAQQFDNPDSVRSAINNQLKGKSQQSYGYHWSYDNHFNYVPAKNNYAAVACYLDDGTFVKSYTKMTDAIADTKASNIISAIQGKIKHSGGYRWRYFYGNTSNIKPL